MSSHSKYAKQYITPFEGSTLAQARQAVIDAFKSSDYEYAWQMLRVFYISTAKEEIMDECEKTEKEVEQQLEIFNKKMEACSQEHLKYPIVLARNSYLKKVDFSFYKQIMRLIAKVGWTEFEAVKPKFESTGRLGSGPSR